MQKGKWRPLKLTTTTLPLGSGGHSEQQAEQQSSRLEGEYAKLDCNTNHIGSECLLTNLVSRLLDTCWDLKARLCTYVYVCACSVMTLGHKITGQSITNQLKLQGTCDCLPHLHTTHTHTHTHIHTNTHGQLRYHL